MFVFAMSDMAWLLLKRDHGYMELRVFKNRRLCDRCESFGRFASMSKSTLGELIDEGESD
jgi:hypothetical protein